MNQIIIEPQPKQEEFLSSSADIVIFGGGAGGGKSFALLLEPLRHISNKEFSAVIFRRTSPQITNPGGLWDESSKLYPSLAAIPKQTSHEWQFPKGSNISFAHLQYEKNVHDWQGSQVAFIGFDELPHFTEYQFFYMLSRNRSTSGVKPYVRATCNPDADSWLAVFLEWWIDQDTGYPIPERCGKLRYFVRESNHIHWADSKEELKIRFPHLYEIAGEDFALSVTFIPSSVYDNPALMKADPGYLAKLLSLPLVEKERLLGGNWKIKLTSGKFINRAWFEIIEVQKNGGELCRFWDFAATEKQLKNDPDYSASVLMRKIDDEFIIEDFFQMQASPADVERIFFQTARLDREFSIRTKARLKTRWEIEPGSASRRENARLIKQLAGYDARGVESREDKLTRARGFAVQAEHGNVKMKKGEWNGELLTHLHGQPDLPHDDGLDGCSGSFNELAGKRSATAY
jgi:predicted phage terminase large subunit-like protein